MSEFRCVAIETSSPAGSLAVCDGERVVQRTLAEGSASSRQVFGVMRELLAELSLTPADLTCVAFGCGPGSFTGVRVAASAAQGLAFARQLPVASVSSLAAVAWRAVRQGADGLLCACLDARMGEAYIAAYRAAGSGGLSCEYDDRLVNPSEWRLPAELQAAVAVGPGWPEFPELYDGTFAASLTEFGPDAEAVLELARLKFAAGDLVAAGQALPNYIRNNVTQ